ncbi:hypothetical protein [Atlantibacter hermannii]|uniref:hypothetical protein n=1 Tax=Atlantibacter hermannii TaxID=565 RepID=UPI0028A67848|nr:hypothetical protein [Atlantibacter hermannii]
MKLLIITAALAATLARVAYAADSVKILSTNTPEKYNHITGFCADVYKKQLDAGIVNGIAANLQASCYLAIEASLKGDAVEYRAASKRLDAVENETVMELAQDPAALIQSQYDFAYMGSFEFAQKVLLNSKGKK